MKKNVDNAIIMAAGTSSRFAPLSYEMPKALINVKGEVLIERQIKQLQERGITNVIVVTGYMAEKFEYLKDKYGVSLLYNPEFLTRNNNGSIYAAREYINNSYICSADNYFISNPFESSVDSAYYAALYADGVTKEWCMTEDEEGYINHVEIGGKNAWYMLGHTFWDEKFSAKFLAILHDEYNNIGTAEKLWESIFIDHLDMLKMRIKKYKNDEIYEFDTLDELRKFDVSYCIDSRSDILKDIALKHNCSEAEIVNIRVNKNKDGIVSGFCFEVDKKGYIYDYITGEID